MSRAARKNLNRKLQNSRSNRLLISYVTSTRVGYEIQIADDAFRIIYDHLEAGPGASQEWGRPIVLYSNGGSGTVPLGVL